MLKLDGLERQRDMLYSSLDHVETKKAARSTMKHIKNIESEIQKLLVGEERTIEDIEREYFDRR